MLVQPYSLALTASSCVAVYKPTNQATLHQAPNGHDDAITLSDRVRERIPPCRFPSQITDVVQDQSITNEVQVVSPSCFTLGNAAGYLFKKPLLLPDAFSLAAFA